MKAIIPEVEQFKLYDKAIAKDIEAIAELAKFNKEHSAMHIGMVYNNSVKTQYLFQLMKIYNSCVKGCVVIYVEANRKNFKRLKKENPSINLKRINLFNKPKTLYVVDPKYLETLNKDNFSKERFYTDELIFDIWYAYYEPKIEEEVLDEISDLL